LVGNCPDEAIYLMKEIAFENNKMSMQFVFGDREDKEKIEKGSGFTPKFGEDGLIPAVAQDSSTGDVLMVAYMNEEALRQTIEKQEAVYYSRSRSTLWHKGATSGHIQKVTEIRTDCDQDVVLLKVKQIGPGCCHVGYGSCFYRKVPIENESSTMIQDNIIQLEQCAERTYDPEQVY